MKKAGKISPPRVAWSMIPAGEVTYKVIDQDIPAPVISLALIMRLASRNQENYAAKLLATMRNQFGGHAVKEVQENDE